MKRFLFTLASVTASLIGLSSHAPSQSVGQMTNETEAGWPAQVRGDEKLMAQLLDQIEPTFVEYCPGGESQGFSRIQ